MKTPQQYIWDWAFTNDHRIFVNLDKERYWLVWTNGRPVYWNFENNNTNDIPNYDYSKIKQVLKKAGYKYYV